MKAILVTGGAGFIGSNFIAYFLEKHRSTNIINVDKLTYAADINNLQDVENNPNYIFVKGDICDKGLINFLFDKYSFDGVIHFAAESHVDNSIEHPDTFIQTNVFGTFNLLDAAYKQWMKGPNTINKNFLNSRFVHISTDEVYGSLGETGLFSETTAYAPNSPYSCLLYTSPSPRDA